MWRDPIIEEIHRTREKIADAYGNDMHAIFVAAQRGELANALDQSHLDSVQAAPTRAPDREATERKH